MKRALLIAAAGIAALAFALPATAGTVSFRGVVVAKDSARKSIVTVSRNGVVRTIRARGLKRVRVGRLVAVQAASLPDGTFAASKVRPLGRAGRARFRATADDGTIEMAVVHRGRVYVKVPDNVMVPDFQPGDEIVAVVTVNEDGSFTLIKAENEDGDDGGGVNGDGTFTVVGVISSLSVDRIFLKVDEHHDPVTCAVPEDFDTEGFAVGQVVQMTC